MEIVKLKQYGLSFDQAIIELKRSYTDEDIVAQLIAVMYSFPEREPSIAEIAYNLQLGEETVSALISNPAFNDKIDSHLASLMYTPRDRRDNIKALVDRATNKPIVTTETRKSQAVIKGQIHNLEETRTITEYPTTKDLIFANEQLELKQQRARRLPKDYRPDEGKAIIWEGLSPEDVEDATFKEIAKHELMESNSIERKKDYEEYAKKKAEARQKFRDKISLFVSDPSDLPPEHILNRETKPSDEQLARATDFFRRGIDEDSERTSLVDGYETPDVNFEEAGIAPQKKIERVIDYKTQQEREKMEDTNPQKDRVGGIYRNTSQKKLFSSEEIKEEIRKRAEMRKRFRNNGRPEEEKE